MIRIHDVAEQFQCVVIWTKNNLPDVIADSIEDLDRVQWVILIPVKFLNDYRGWVQAEGVVQQKLNNKAVIFVSYET